MVANPGVVQNDDKEKRTDDISSCDSDFLKVDQGTLFEIILAANYLDIKVGYNFQSLLVILSTGAVGLLDVTCKTVANLIGPRGDQGEFQHQESDDNYSAQLRPIIKSRVD